jgi:hypothetical protein
MLCSFHQVLRWLSIGGSGDRKKCRSLKRIKNEQEHFRLEDLRKNSSVLMRPGFVWKNDGCDTNLTEVGCGSLG